MRRSSTSLALYHLVAGLESCVAGQPVAHHGLAEEISVGVQHKSRLWLVLLRVLYLEVACKRVHADPHLALEAKLLSDFLPSGKRVALISNQAIVKTSKINN